MMPIHRRGPGSRAHGRRPRSAAISRRNRNRRNTAGRLWNAAYMEEIEDRRLLAVIDYSELARSLGTELSVLPGLPFELTSTGSLVASVGMACERAFIFDVGGHISHPDWFRSAGHRLFDVEFGPSAGLLRQRVSANWKSKP